MVIYHLARSRLMAVKGLTVIFLTWISQLLLLYVSCQHETLISVYVRKVPPEESKSQDFDNGFSFHLM